MRLHDEFEWDAAKAQANWRKHRVSFDLSAEVLCDEDGDRFHVEEYDDAHSSDEERWITTASHPSDRAIVLRIAWTQRDRITRIISARLATKHERREYEEAIQQ